MTLAQPGRNDPAPYTCVCSEEWCFCDTVFMLTTDEAFAAQAASGEVGNMGTCGPCREGQHIWERGGERTAMEDPYA